VETISRRTLLTDCKNSPISSDSDGLTGNTTNTATAQIHTVRSPRCAGSPLPGEGRDPCVAWAPAFAGVAETLMSALVCSCRVNLLNGSEHYRLPKWH
jgi:hypothetical protein